MSEANPQGEGRDSPSNLSQRAIPFFRPPFIQALKWVLGSALFTYVLGAQLKMYHSIP